MSSSLLLFPQRFGRYVLWPSSGVCRTREPTWNFELRPLLNPRGSPVLYTSHRPNQEHNQRQWTNETHFFIKIYLSHFILERGTQFVVSLRVRWRDIYSERGLLLAPYLLPGAKGCQRLHPPLESRIVRDVRDASDRLCTLRSTLDSDWTVVLISHDPLPVTHLLDRPTLTHCLLITTWQLVKAHGVARKEPKIHVNSHDITPVLILLAITRYKC